MKKIKVEVCVPEGDVCLVHSTPQKREKRCFMLGGTFNNYCRLFKVRLKTVSNNIALVRTLKCPQCVDSEVNE